MPATPNKKSKANKPQKSSAKRSDLFAGFSSEFKYISALVAAGAILGLSAPGIELWFVAWFGLVPLLLSTLSRINFIKAFIRGTAFGIGYNLVYLNWYLGLQPLDWLNFNWWQGWLMATTAWFIASTHQALIVGLFSSILSMIPLNGSFVFRKIAGRWKAPALLVIPLVWTVFCNFIANAHSATGVPWTMLEYSQYRIISLIQIASIVGGIGLGSVIVLFNTCLASAFVSFQKKRAWEKLAPPNKLIGLYQLSAVFFIVVAITIWGYLRASTPKSQPDVKVTVLQGNINIDMQKTKRRLTTVDLLTHYSRMANSSERGLLVWTENALPAYFCEEPTFVADLARISRVKETDMVVGSLDRDKSRRPFNAAWGITAAGHVLPFAYHKRYLVPFGEYMPILVRYMPEWMQRLTNTPAGGGFESGKEPVVLELSCGKVAPLICFETISPELVASSVRAGGQLLVNLSDLAWFHDSIAGRQMIAFSVMRAVENQRYFVFAANTGPSAIIDPEGRIEHLSKQNEEILLTGKVKMTSEITPFTHWFVF